MKIIVFGATGGVGKSVVQQGLDAGFEVTAFVRTPTKLNLSHARLTIVQGDAFNKDQVEKAIEGHDAVVSCLASSNGMKKSTELQEMIGNVVNGMKTHGVKRIVYTASAGVHNELTGVSGKLIMAMLKNALVDHRAAVECIQRNELIYTIVRPMGLTNDPFTGIYRESNTNVPSNAKSISRADVAHFIIKSLQDEQYFNISVGIAS